MRTTKPFSTISYNSKSYLNVKLQELIKKRIINFFCFIEHYKEDDEKKNHFHVFIIPNGAFNTDQLTDYLLEPLLGSDESLPLGIKPCRASKWDDWYLYCSHNEPYLIAKGQQRKYHYTDEDFISSDSDYFLELVHTIDKTKIFRQSEFVKRVYDGETLFTMIESGFLPISQIAQWSKAYDLLHVAKTLRNDRKTHTPEYDIVPRTDDELPFNPQLTKSKKSQGN